MDQNQLGIEARWSALEWAERLGDLVVAGAVIAATLPLMVLAACAIRFEGPGAILRPEERIGPSGRRFFALKFRTTLGQAETNSYRYEELTWVGQFLRYTGIEDLPQMFNLLRGDVSVLANLRQGLFPAD
jgi:putative colanic acid biosynthesis UDP-glucose lipid carrier transferase